jgi:hypothetical protein
VGRDREGREVVVSDEKILRGLADRIDTLQEMVSVLSQRLDLLNERLGMHVARINELDRRTVGSARSGGD